MDRLLRRDGEPALRIREYSAEGSVRGAVLMTPGFSDHVERHDEICSILAEHGFLVTCWDLRGQGRSEGRRAHVDRFSDFVDDALFVAAEMDRKDEWAAAGPPILCGHSTGALVCILTCLAAPRRFRALALVSPFVGLKLPAPRWRKALAHGLTGVIPKLYQPTGIDQHTMTHDRELAAASQVDPLKHDKISLRMFTELLGATERAMREAPNLKLPIYCRAAGDDKLADLEATKRFMRRVGSADAKLEIAEGQYHELHREVERREHARILAERFTEWCQSEAPTTT
jgi:alpha-beta hydrolase superfamily lysophospholipase